MNNKKLYDYGKGGFPQEGGNRNSSKWRFFYNLIHELPIMPSDASVEDSEWLWIKVTKKEAAAIRASIQKNYGQGTGLSYRVVTVICPHENGEVILWVRKVQEK